MDGLNHPFLKLLTLFQYALYQIYVNAGTSKKCKQLRALVDKSKYLQKQGAESTTGTTHSFSYAEYCAFADWISTVLNKDNFLVQNNYLPIDRNSEKRQLFQRCSDGILFW